MASLKPICLGGTALAMVPLGEAQIARPSRRGRLVPWAIVGLILGCTVLQRFGLTIGDATLNAAHLFAYALLAAALAAGLLTFNAARLSAFCALIVVVCLSWMINETWGMQGDSSPKSFALLTLTYLPFVFMMRRPAGGDAVDTEWILSAFANVALFCAMAGILQFAAQFVIRADWLFDFTPYLPPALRSSSGYNTVIPVGGLFKSNGFFFKEPSMFSLVLAFALLLEISRFKRWLRMGVLTLALLLTYSGSGLLVLAVGLLFPLHVRTLVRLAIAVVSAGLLALLFWDVLNLSFTLARLDEFGNPRSSAYQRYVAPTQLIADSILQRPWTLWLGYGPGTIYRSGFEWRWFYEYHDPTVAKLLFEYGVFGLLMAATLALLMLRNSEAPLQVRAASFFCWIATGGFLVTPELAYPMLFFGSLVQPVAATLAANVRDRTAPATAPV
jgi:hypothetical protein